MDTHDKKLAFILKMTKHGLDSIQHLDAGGTVNALATPNPNTTLTGPSMAGTQNAVNPNTGLAGTIGGALGLNDTFKATGANVQAGTNAGQLNNAYTGTQGALTTQTGLATTLTPQAQAAANQQAALATQLQNEANGQGPNVAVNELNQATGQNTANQAALMASQRGAGANPGEIARLAAQQGAANQQQAAGQAATLEAQQQIAAQNNLAGLSANQITQAGTAANNATQAQLGEQGILQNANTSMNNTQAGIQSNINNVNAATAAANQKSNTGILGGIINGVGGAIAPITSALSGLGLAEGGEVKRYYNGDIAKKSIATTFGDTGAASEKPTESSDNTPAKPVNGPTDAQIDEYNSPKNKAIRAQYGYPDNYATGGQANPIVGNPLLNSSPGSAQSFAGQWLNNGGGNSASNGPNIAATPAFDTVSGNALYTNSGKSSSSPAKGTIAGGANDTEGMPSDSMPGPEAPAAGQYDNATELMAAKGGQIKNMKTGGKVKAASPKEKAKVKDNSYSNDKIPGFLSEGEIVLPRTVTMHPDAPNKAAEFVRMTLAKKKQGLRRTK